MRAIPQAMIDHNSATSCHSSNPTTNPKLKVTCKTTTLENKSSTITRETIITHISNTKIDPMDRILVVGSINEATIIIITEDTIIMVEEAAIIIIIKTTSNEVITTTIIIILITGLDKDTDLKLQK